MISADARAGADRVCWKGSSAISVVAFSFSQRRHSQDHGCDTPVYQERRKNLTPFNRLLIVQGKSWCCQTGLNCRPLHYQWSALPLSYGSVPGIRGNRPKRLPARRAGSCHKGPSGASMRVGREQAKMAKIGASCCQACRSGKLAGNPGPIRFPFRRRRRIMTSRVAAQSNPRSSGRPGRPATGDCSASQ